MTIKTKRLDTVTTLTAVIVFFAVNVMRRDPVARMIPHVASNAVVTTQTIVFLVTGVAIALLTLGRDRMII